MPSMTLANDEGVELFTTIDTDEEWRGRPRPPGRYVSTAWIPGNHLAEGTFYLQVNLNTIEPYIWEIHAPDAVAFQVIDSMDGDTARVDWGGRMRGVVRPMLEWTTRRSDQSASGDGVRAVL
jgi:lipopolysaccharide transport system ATP-binding protein